MLTLLRRIGVPVAALSLLVTLAGCVVYPAGGGYYERPHGYWGHGGGYGGGYGGGGHYWH
jgi:hypothetical protein